MTTDYRAILTEIPDLAAQLAGQIIPSSQPADGQPKGNNRPDAARVVAIDDLDQLFREIGQSIRYWQQAFAQEWELPPVPDAVQAITVERYSKVVSDDPLQAARDIRPAVDWLLAQWDDAEGHPLFDWWTASLDDWLVPAVRRLEVRKIAQRPRKCPNCSATDMWADVQHISALCSTCGAVERAEVWLSVKEAAARLSVEPRTVRRWVADGNVEGRKSGRTSQVELGECRRHQDDVRAAAILRLPIVR